MKSTEQMLVSRGYLKDNMEQEFLHLSTDEKIALLQHTEPVKRTLGARLLGAIDSDDAVSALITALQKEKKLYPKMEICNSLVNIGVRSVHPLIAQLGKIGSNQYTYIPQKTFGKKNYPLQRDIAARTLARIGAVALPALLDTLQTNDVNQLSEAIDAIGYIAYYATQTNVPGFEELTACFYKQKQNEIIRWKIYRAMSAFPQSIDFLHQQKKIEESTTLINEINRSLKVMKR